MSEQYDDLLPVSLHGSQLGAYYLVDRHNDEIAMFSPGLELEDMNRIVRLINREDNQMKPTLDIWTVYERPKDYPEGFVARLHVVSEGQTNPTDTAFFGPTLESVRENIPKGLVRMDRSPLDEPQIVEVWL